jgi:hypothetical protein
MNKSNRARQVVIVLASLAVLVLSVLIVGVSFPRYAHRYGMFSEQVFVFYAILFAGLVAVSGCGAYLWRMRRLGASLLVLGGMTFFSLAGARLAESGLGGDFYPVLFFLAAASLVPAGLVATDRRPTAPRPSVQVSPRPGLRRIADLTPDDFPGVDAIAFRKWKQSLVLARFLGVLAALLAFAVSAVTLLEWGIATSLLATCAFITIAWFLIRTIPADRLDIAGLRPEALEDALRRSTSP